MDREAVSIRFHRHAGLVPASTVQHIHRPLAKRRGGCRHRAGM